MGKTSTRHITAIATHLNTATTSLDQFVRARTEYEAHSSNDKVSTALRLGPDAWARFRSTEKPIVDRMDAALAAAKAAVRSAKADLAVFDAFIKQKKSSTKLPKIFTSIGSSERFIASAGATLTGLEPQLNVRIPRR